MLKITNKQLVDSFMGLNRLAATRWASIKTTYHLSRIKRLAAVAMDDYGVAQGALFDKFAAKHESGALIHIGPDGAELPEDGPHTGQHRIVDNKGYSEGIAALGKEMVTLDADPILFTDLGEPQGDVLVTANDFAVLDWLIVDKAPEEAGKDSKAKKGAMRPEAA